MTEEDAIAELRESIEKIDMVNCALCKAKVNDEQTFHAGVLCDLTNCPFRVQNNVAPKTVYKPRQ